MRRLLLTAVLVALVLPNVGRPTDPARGFSPSHFPREASAWHADGGPETYDRTTVYDYMDGGAEVYLEYGMRALFVQRYARQGEAPVTFDLFEMDSPAGAYGAFTFEREDEEAGIGQASEYGGGLLRFWQGRYFGFVQAESETPASREGVLALGRTVAGLLGPPGTPPALPRALPAEGLRRVTVRYVVSPLLLQTRETLMEGNPLALPKRCETVLARYGEKGSPQRVIIARYPDAGSARKGAGSIVRAEFPEGVQPGRPYQEGGTWCLAESTGAFVIVVLDAPDEAAAMRQSAEARRRLGALKR